MAARLRLIFLLPWLVVLPAGAVDLFGSGEQEFLHPDEAFVLTVMPEDSERLQASFRVAEGYYLYRDKTSFSIAGHDAGLMPYQLPSGIVKDDPLFGEVQTWSGDVAVDLRLAEVLAGSDEVALIANYQGCAERGVCYPPQTKTLKVGLVADTPVPPPPPKSGTSGGLLSRADQIAQDLAGETLAWSFLVFGGFGLLLAFTPCVLPMIPILAGVIAGANAGTARALRLSLVYVLAMAATYAVLGVIIGLTGANLQAYMQNVWVIGGFVLILILLAFSMFGVYEFRMPAALHNFLHQVGERFVGSGSYLSAAVMGLLGALVASPCVSPPLVGALIHIADTGNAVHGAVSLFGMGLGLGLPLLVFGGFEGRLMPHSGPWMVRIKAVFGVLLLALSIWMLDRVVPGQVTLGLSGLLLLLLGMILHAVESLPPDANTMSRLGRGVGLAFLIYGGVLLVGAATGGDSLLRPWAHFTNPAGPAVQSTQFQPIKTVAGMDRALAAAKGQPVLVDFHADWCVTCHELDAFTFSDPDVQARMRRFTLLRADVTANDEDDKELLDSLGLFGPPAIIFYTAEGEELRAFRTVSYVPAPKFAAMLDEVLEFSE